MRPESGRTHKIGTKAVIFQGMRGSAVLLLRMTQPQLRR